MLGFLIYILTVNQVHSECNVEGFCPQSSATQNEIVDHHNALRRAVQPTASDMLKMNYSEELGASAQAWIDQCALAHGPKSTRMISGYEMGENLFYSSKPYTWLDVINAWHSEVIHYKYPNGSADGKTIGHYTQVIWNSSYRVGCGMKLCPNGIYYYGCHYYRAGNFRGWPPYKVGPPCGLCPNACEDNLCTNPCPYVDHFINCPTLVKNNGCGFWLIPLWCPATCSCTNEIIPISKR